MTAKTTEHLKLDRRLLKRRGWIDEEELQRALNELPDAAEKIHREEDGAGSLEESPTPDEPPGSGSIG